MTPHDFAALARLEAAATPGPWTRKKPQNDADGWPMGVVIGGTPGRQTVYASPPGGSYPSADADLIAAARNALGDLLAVVRELAEANTPRNGDAWHEDVGCVLWFHEPIDEPPYCGHPNDDGFPWASTPLRNLRWVPLPAVFNRGSAALARFSNIVGAEAKEAP